MRLILLSTIMFVGCYSGKTSFELRAPLHFGKITSNSGGRWGRLHLGMDIGVPKFTPVKVTARGIVTRVKYRDKIFGNRVDVFHPEIGLFSSYSHLQEVHVIEGQELDDRDKIGLVGSTGKSTGPHLHFEVYNANGAFMNPLDIIKKHNFTFRKDTQR